MRNTKKTVQKTHPEVTSGRPPVIKRANLVDPICTAYRLAGHHQQEETSRLLMGNVVIGGAEPVIIAGPCSVEDEEQMVSIARAVKAAGATVLRGGAFGPHKSLKRVQGMGARGLKLLALTGRETGLPIVTEVRAAGDVETVARYSDVLQVAASHMQNFNLLDAVAESARPVILERGLAATYQDWLQAAEYLMESGNQAVVLCERGVRTFGGYTSLTMDIAAIPAIKRLSHLPIIADPSHSTGKWHLVAPVSLAAIAAGAHGLSIEVQPDPDVAGRQGSHSLNFENFSILMDQVRSLVTAMRSELTKVR